MIDPLTLGNIPPQEHERFCSVLVNAVRAGARGDLQAGYAILDLGLAWAETADRREAWYGDLILCYQTAIYLYCARYLSPVDEEPVTTYRGGQLGR